jgi:hypothetical protein
MLGVTVAIEVSLLVKFIVTPPAGASVVRLTGRLALCWGAIEGIEPILIRLLVVVTVAVACS